MDIASYWNHLHNQPRFRPIYPSDHAVRFLMANQGLLKAETSPRFLDIGLGAGRHIKLAFDLGFNTFGVDISISGLSHAQELPSETGTEPAIALASFQSLPFADDSFHLVLSHGVFYYGTSDDMFRGIAEAHRVLRPQGKLFAVLRTVDDYRFAKGEKLAPNTFRLIIDDTNECGTIQHFLSADDIPVYFGMFGNVSFEISETSTSNRKQLHSDWLITAEK